MDKHSRLVSSPGCGEGGVDDVGQGLRFSGLVGMFELRRAPYLVRHRHHVHFVVRVVGRVFVVDGVAKGGFLVGGAEEPLASTEHDRVGVKTLAYAPMVADHLLDASGWEHRGHDDLVGGLADAVHAPGALHHSHHCPRQVVVDHDPGILEVLPLRQDIGGHQHPYGRRALGDPAQRCIGQRREPARSQRGVGVGAGDRLHAVDPALSEGGGYVGGGVGVLGEHDHLLGAVVVAGKPDEGVKLGIGILVPVADAVQDTVDQPVVEAQLLSQFIGEQQRSQALDLVGLDEPGVGGFGVSDPDDRVNRKFIVASAVVHIGRRRLNGNGTAHRGQIPSSVDGKKEDVVAEAVAAQRGDECGPRRPEPLVDQRPGEADQVQIALRLLPPRLDRRGLVMRQIVSLVGALR